jgi:hypothetical protein
MLFHNRHTHFLLKPSVTFNKITVDYNAEIKFLCIQIMDTLRWHSHTQLLPGKLCKVVFMVKSLKEVLSLNLIWNIYSTKFHWIHRFGILFGGGGGGAGGGGTGGELTTRILRIQKHVIRSTVGVSSRIFCRQLFKELNILTLISLYTVEVICYIRKHQQFVQIYSNIHTYNTWRKIDIHSQSYNTDLYHRNVMKWALNYITKFLVA